MADPWHNDEKMMAMLCQAVSSGDLDRIKRSVPHDMAVDDAATGTTLLHQAVIKGKGDIVDYLLTLNPDMRIKDKDGSTAFHYALKALFPHDDMSFRIVTALVKNGADVNELNISGWRPMQQAALSGHIAAMDLFMFHGANINAMSARNETILNAVVTCCYHPDKVLHYLILHGADVTMKDDDGFDLDGILFRRGEERRLRPVIKQALEERQQLLNLQADLRSGKALVLNGGKMKTGKIKARKLKPHV